MKRAATALAPYLLLLIAGSGPLMAASLYDITDVGTLGGSALATGLNDYGQVVGYCDESGVVRGFVWDAGVMTEIDAMTGHGCYARGINNSGFAVGYYWRLSSSYAFTWEGGVTTTVGVPWGNCSVLNAINDSGVAVGSGSSNNGEGHPAYWDGSWTDIGQAGGISSGLYGINEADLMIGNRYDNGGLNRNAVLWDDVNGWRTLGTMEGTGASGLCLNNVGDYGGYRTVNYTEHQPYVFDGTDVHVISLGGTTTTGDRPYTLGINDSRQAVGRDRTATGEMHAFLWDNGTTWDLNSLLLPGHDEWELIDAWDINASGQICGSAITPEGTIHAFLATPASSPTPDDSPEPATWVLLACTVLAGSVARRRRR